MMDGFVELEIVIFQRLKYTCLLPRAFMVSFEKLAIVLIGWLICM